MLAILKLLVGVAGVGTGVAVPVMVKKFVSTTGKVFKAMSESQIAKTIREEIKENKENTKLLEALKDLQSKNCKLVQNPENPNNSFEALYACKETNDQSNFYYLGKREEVKKNGVSEVKKVKTVNYEKEGENHKLALTLEEKSSTSTTVIKMAIKDQNDGGWAHFRNVELSKSCKVVTPMLGTSTLECNLTKDGQNFGYNFAVL